MNTQNMNNHSGSGGLELTRLSPVYKVGFSLFKESPTQRTDNTMEPFNIHDAKTNFSKLIAFALAGEEVIIAKAGQPLVKILPITEKQKQKQKQIEEENKESRFGAYKGKIKIADDFDAPVPDEILNTFYKEIASFEAKNKLSALLKEVENGGSYTITVRGQPIADLVPTKGLKAQEMLEAIKSMQDAPRIKGVSAEDIKSMITEGRK